MKQIEMKKNTLYAIATLLTLSLFFVACNDDDLVNGPAPKEGDCIKFSVGGKNSRTVYNESDPWQIDWLTNGTDKIRIYSAEARKGDGTSNVCADYSVTPYATEVSGQTINGQTINKYVSYKNGWLEPNLSGLEWGAANKHNFYAVYPADDSKLAGYDYENGIITFNYNSNQKCTLTGSSNTENGITVYTTNPDMSNAYMVAKASASKSNTYNEENPIELQFEPIMTTLDITVRGTDNSAVPVTITGISVINEFAEGTAVLSNGKFNYDIDVKTSNNQSGIQTTEDGVSTLTTYVNVTDASGNVGKQLQSTQALKVTVFLPPIALTSATTAIQVHYAANFVSGSGGNGVMKTMLKSNSGDVTVSAESKRRVTLAQIPTPLTNNWMTPLDDDIYVSQLSIPGSHDAATGDGTTFSLGKTQDLDLEDQWTLGIRCFDLRPRYGNNNESELLYGNNLWINHGQISTTWSMDAAVKLFKTKLEENPGEFAIIIMRHETEGDDTSSSWPDEMAKALASYKSLINSTTGEGLTVDFKPDLTIEECRGKILFMMRSWTQYTDGPTVGGYHGWNHNKEFDQVNSLAEIKGPQSSPGKLMVQDFYNISLGGILEYLADEASTWLGGNGLGAYSAVRGDVFVKQKHICDLLDYQSANYTKDDFTNMWVINHLSGYTMYAAFDNPDLALSTTEGYRYNARNNNIIFYNYLLGNSVDIDGKSRKKQVGPAGIVLMDFVGVASSGNIQVNGHLSPQVIIDNNYKYHLKRKGE